MADYIDRNELVRNLDRFAPEHLTPLLRSLIEKQPTADVVEVVRCKDCAYYNAKLMTCYNNDFPFNCESRPIMRETDYCSYGERRTDNDL